MFLREKVVSRVEKDVVLGVGEPGGSLGRLHLAHLGGGGLENAAKGPLHTWPTKAKRQKISKKPL